MRNVSRRLAARRNGYRAVRLFEGEDVVHAVARHGDGVALFFDGAHEDRLLFGSHAPEHGVLVRHVLHFEVGESVERDVLSGVLHAHAPCDFRYRHGVVARNDLDVHVVLAEPLDGLDGVRTDVVGKGDDRRGAEEGGQPPARNGVGRIGKQQHPEPRRGVLFYDLVDLGGHGAEHELRRAHRKGACVAEGHRREFPLARKGHRRRRLQRRGMPEAVIQRDGGLVVVLKGVEHAPHDLFQGEVHIVVEDHAVVHRHPAVRDGTRLIQAQHVHARQHFQRIQILHERLFLGEPPHADRHGKRGEKEQSRGDHADDDRPRELDGEAHVGSRRLPVDPEHRRGDEGDENADHADKEADGVHDLRLGLFILLRLGGEAVEVGRLAHLVGAHAAGAARHIGAGVQRFAGRLLHGHALARQERFVHFHHAVQKDAVRGDLLPRLQQDDVVEDDLPYGDLGAYPAPQHLRRRRYEHGELVDLPLCEDLLHDADDEVRREDGDEEELREGRPRIGERHRHDQAQQVEERAEVPHEDARVRLGVLLVYVVEEELRKAQFHLFGGEPLIGLGVEPLHFLRGGDVLRAAELFHERLSRFFFLFDRVGIEHARREGLAYRLLFRVGLFCRGHGCLVLRKRRRFFLFQ